MEFLANLFGGALLIWFALCEPKLRADMRKNRKQELRKNNHV